jgi:hypothetical protein
MKRSRFSEEQIIAVLKIPNRPPPLSRPSLAWLGAGS